LCSYTAQLNYYFAHCSIVKTSYDNQERIDTDILFGESQKASENKKLVKKMTLIGLPKKPAGFTRVKFIFSIDTNGKLRIQMLSLDTGKEELYHDIDKRLIEEC
jgi:molecular chaperone DnaK (HSP70)